MTLPSANPEDIRRLLQSGTEHYRAARPAQAEEAYREVLARHPDHPDALHLMGVLAHDQGDAKQAAQWIGKAIAINPAASEYYFDLAMAFAALGSPQRAIEALQQGIGLRPAWPVAHIFLGMMQQQLGDAEQAAASMREAVRLEPGNPEWHFNLANAYLADEQRKLAIEAFEECLRITPTHAAALNNLGHTQYTLKQYDRAQEMLQRAVNAKPAFAEALHNLGLVLLAQNRLEEALLPLQRAVDLRANSPDFLNSLASAFSRLNRYDEAINAFQKGIALKPHWPQAYHDLSRMLREKGDYPAAIAASRECIRQQPDFEPGQYALALALKANGELDEASDILAQLTAKWPRDDRMLSSYAAALAETGKMQEALDVCRQAAEANRANIYPASDYLFNLQFCCDDPKLILDEHRKWEAIYAAPFRKHIPPFTNDRSSERRLKIGYVSPDFIAHCQALFTTALFPHHDPQRVQIYCYFSGKKPDAVTDWLKSHVDEWRTIGDVSDDAACEMIRADGIDVLVDLTMHMRLCRPLLFARKPAPVQVAWLAYPGTTGLQTMDYRLSDPYLDPPGFESRYTEKTLHLPETFWCIDPHMGQSGQVELPQPGELPAKRNGYVTFGGLNNFTKINAPTLLRWGQVMQSVPNSRLHSIAPRGRSREWVVKQLAASGIGADRVTFVDRQKRNAYLAEYEQIDLCLDTLPYNGHTTSIDAFWMGVPVLTQIGPTVVGRAGFSQLRNLKLEGFCAQSDEEFLHLAKRWREDLDALAEVRTGLRERVTYSPLMDAKKFAARMEDAFGRMWQAWISS